MRAISLALLVLLCPASMTHAAELLVNGSFEQVVHDFPVGWERADRGGRVAYALDPGIDGERALKVEILAPGTTAEISQRDLSLAAQQTYALSFQARGAGLSGSRVKVQVRAAGDHDETLLDADVPVTPEWREHRLNFSTGPHAPKAVTVIFEFGPAGRVWFDQVSLQGEPGPLLKNAVPQFVPRLPASSARNLVPNGSFECGADGWLSLGRPLAFGGNIAGLYGTVTSGDASEGAHAFRLRLGPGLTPESYYDCWPPEHLTQRRLLTVNRGWIQVKRGQPYTLSADLRADQAGTLGVLQFNFSADAREPVQTIAHEVKLTREWARYTHTVIAPADSVFVGVGVDVTASPNATVTFAADAIQLEAGERATRWNAHEPVEVGFDCGRYGNGFDAGKPVVIDVVGSNTSAAPVSLAVHAVLTDYWDRPLPEKIVTLDVSAHGTAKVPLTFELAPGFYRARFAWTEAGREHTRIERLAVIEPFAGGDSPFGLNHGPTTAEALRQIRRAGITWVRNWSVNWEWIEPRPGPRSYAASDAEIGRLSAAGMNVLSLLPPNPSTNWASEAPPSVPPTLWHRLAYAPKVPAQLFDFVGAAATHYRDAEDYWEFLNEPLWVPDFCLPKKGGYTVADYIALLKGASAAIHRANPRAKVIGGLAVQSEMRLGDEFIRAGGLAYVDIYNLHPYPGTRTPESYLPDLERIRKAMDDSGTKKIIWATETGYYGLDEYPFLPWHPPAEHFAANRLLASEQECGDYIVRYSTIMLAHGVQKIFWHEPVTGDANNGIRDIENVFIAPGGLPRKAYAAISGLANVLGPAPDFGGQWLIPADLAGDSTQGIHGFAFAAGKHSVLIAWTAAKERPSRRWSVLLPAGSTARDIVGAPISGDQIALSDSPVYIVNPSLPPAELARQCLLKKAP